MGREHLLMPWRLITVERTLQRRLLLTLAVLTSILASVGTFTGVYSMLTMGKQVTANCEVLSILLLNRADRDKTLELFEPIRRENPAQFDKLVKRAEEGDRRLAGVQEDLSCDVLPE